ncbi:MAG: polysaccharide pyruvyl transferase family protein [Lachnospiraceae bacterium]|nr:polysaccharide pyruvyl transferase family protein [Lachnospiraceae bacterium]
MNVELFSEMLFKPTEKKIEEEQRKFVYPLRQAHIEERLFSLIHSDFVVTDSFHGVCFSIIFHIPFLAILNKNRGASRFYTLLKKL